MARSPQRSSGTAWSSLSVRIEPLSYVFRSRCVSTDPSPLCHHFRVRYWQTFSSLLSLSGPAVGDVLIGHYLVITCAEIVSHKRFLEMNQAALRSDLEQPACNSFSSMTTVDAYQYFPSGELRAGLPTRACIDPIQYQHEPAEEHDVIVVGAGYAGLIVCRELVSRGAYLYKPVLLSE
jgi:hypothetical protein